MDLIIGGGKYGEFAFQKLLQDKTPVVVVDTDSVCALRTHWHLPSITVDELAVSGIPPAGAGFIRGGIAEAALGPTGVGKTELSRALANFLFDDEHAMVRLDMSEFMERHSVSRLIGAPPGYVGYEEGGKLTESIRRRPYSVILLDEIEKAHPDVFNILLQILDDGRLTDGKGRTVDFRNTLIIMTSNLGSELGRDVFEKGTSFDTLDPKLQERLRIRFRPEFINRIDEIIAFHALTKEQLRSIVEIQFKRLKDRLASQNITVSLSSKAKDHLAEKGYDPDFGARPLKRLIQHRIENYLAQKMLEGKLLPGNAYVIDTENDKIVVNKS